VTSTVQVTLVRDGIGVVGGAEEAGVTAGAVRPDLDTTFQSGCGLVGGASGSAGAGAAGGSGRAEGAGSARSGGGGGAGGGVSAGIWAECDDGQGGAAGSRSGSDQGGTEGSRGGPDQGSAAGRSRRAGEAGASSGLLQPEKADSGSEIGGNSDSGGPDDARPEGDVSRGSVGWPIWAKGGRAEPGKPHTSQDWPATVAPQRGQVPASLATSRPGAWCFPVRPPRVCEPLILVPQTSQNSLLAELWPRGHAVLIPPLFRTDDSLGSEQDMCLRSADARWAGSARAVR